MMKTLPIFVMSILLIALGVWMHRRYQKKRGDFNCLYRRVYIMAGLFLVSGILPIVLSGTKGYILAFPLHIIASIIMALGLLRGMIRTIKDRRTAGARIFTRKVVIVIASLLIVFLGLPTILCKAMPELYRKMAENLRPISGRDGLSRAEFINCFYREKVPGYTYAEPEPITYYSGITGGERPALVLLPIDYDENKQYPVLYLLHGLSGNEYTWLKKKADIIIQNMHYLYDCPEMVVVLPNCNVNPENSTAGMGYQEKCKAYDRTEADVVNYLMPYINEHYSVYTDKAHTAVAGNSMGGRNAMFMAFTHQELFNYVGVFSAAGVVKTGHDFFPPLLDELVLDDEKGGFAMLMLMVGREDFICGDVSYDLHDRLNRAGIDHIFYDVVGPHYDIVWENALYNFCMRVFQ